MSQTRINASDPCTSYGPKKHLINQKTLLQTRKFLSTHNLNENFGFAQLCLRISFYILIFVKNHTFNHEFLTLILFFGSTLFSNIKWKIVAVGDHLWHMEKKTKIIKLFRWMHGTHIQPDIHPMCYLSAVRSVVILFFFFWKYER